MHCLRWQTNRNPSIDLVSLSPFSVCMRMLEMLFKINQFHLMFCLFIRFSAKFNKSRAIFLRWLFVTHPQYVRACAQFMPAKSPPIFQWICGCSSCTKWKKIVIFMPFFDRIPQYQVAEVERQPASYRSFMQMWFHYFDVHIWILTCSYIIFHHPCSSRLLNNVLALSCH